MDLMSVRQEKGRKFTIEIRNHQVRADMHKEDGGEDSAMTPVELLVGSVAACVGMFMQRFCERNKLPSEGILIDAVPTLASNPVRVGNIAIDITVPDGFPEEKREAALEFVRKCPVHNTLKNAPEIDIDFAV